LEGIELELGGRLLGESFTVRLGRLLDGALVVALEAGLDESPAPPPSPSSSEETLIARGRLRVVVSGRVETLEEDWDTRACSYYAMLRVM